MLQRVHVATAQPPSSSKRMRGEGKGREELAHTSCRGFTKERILLMDSPSERPSKSMYEREHLEGGEGGRKRRRRGGEGRMRGEKLGTSV